VWQASEYISWKTVILNKSCNKCINLELQQGIHCLARYGEAKDQESGRQATTMTFAYSSKHQRYGAYGLLPAWWSKVARCAGTLCAPFKRFFQDIQLKHKVLWFWLFCQNARTSSSLALKIHNWDYWQNQIPAPTLVNILICPWVRNWVGAGLPWMYSKDDNHRSTCLFLFIAIPHFVFERSKEPQRTLSEYELEYMHLQSFITECMLNTHIHPAMTIWAGFFFSPNFVILKLWQIFP